MNDRNDADVLDAARNQTEAMNLLTAEVRRLRTYGKRNRRFIWFDIALTILLTVVGFIAFHAVQSAHDANVSAKAARAVAAVATQNNRALCLSSNVARAQQIELWNFVISLNKKPQTAEQKANTAKFESHLVTIFAARNCSHIQPGNP